VMGNSTTSTTRLDIRFTDTTTYSATSNHVNGLKIFNDTATDNGFAGIELAATDGDDYYGSTLLKSIATGTNYSNDFVIQTRHGGNYAERLRISSAGNIGVGQSPNTKFNVKLSAFAATGDDDASDWGVDGIFQLDHSGGNAANNEVLLLGTVSGGVGQIASGIGFGRESTSNWGTYLSLKTHTTGTSNIDELIERVRIDSSGNVQLRQKPSEGSAHQKLQWISNSGSLSAQASWGQGSANFDFNVYRTDSQTNYPYGNFRVLTGHGTSPTEALKVTVGGQVLKARHPFFSGLQYSGAGSTPQSGLTNWKFTNIEVNQGNHFNNSTGYFTCPVAGKYAVMAICNHRASGGSWSSLYIMKNSTTMSDSWQSSALNETHVPISASHILSCAANDTISLAWHNSYSAPSSGGTRGNALAIWLVG